MNPIMVVEENFGAQVRFHYLPETDKFYAHGADLARALLFGNPSDALSRNVFSEYRFKIAVGVGQPAWYLSEPGIYQLLFSSKHPKAVEFQRWVFEDVLPKLRASGGYVMPAATSEQLAELIKLANDRIKAAYKARSVAYKTSKKTGITTMTVFKNGQKEYETQISSYSVPSQVNPQVLIMRHFDYADGVDNCTIDIDSPMKEAYTRFQDYSHVSDRQWTFAEVEEWVRVNFPLR